MIRNITVDGEAALGVDTAEELGRALLTGRYVVASDAVRAEYGLTDTDNSDTQDIVDESDWRDDAWRAEGGELMAWGRKHTAAQKPAWSQDDYHTAFASKIKEQIEQGVAPWQKPYPPTFNSIKSTKRLYSQHSLVCRSIQIV